MIATPSYYLTQKGGGGGMGTAGVNATASCDLKDGKLKYCSLACNVGAKEPRTDCGAGAVCHKEEFDDDSAAGICGYPEPNAAALTAARFALVWGM